MRKNRTLRWSLALLAVAVLIGAGAALSNSGGGEAGEEGPYAEFNALHEAANEGRESKKEGDEASREGPSTPAAEQVGNRAYPRAYVDDRLALKERRTFKAIPSKPSRASFDTGAEFQQALAAPGDWTELGPQTPNVAGQASQFIDPATGEGPTTQESGRVTALAVSNVCEPGTCRMWVAAAGGGIWRTENALASHVQWIAPAADLPTNSFGSLYFDEVHNALYAGSGEPNGSSDSEAGLGLFKSTDLGDQLDPGAGQRPGGRQPLDRRDRRRPRRSEPAKRSTSAPTSPATAPPRSTAAGSPRPTRRRSASTAPPMAAKPSPRRPTSPAKTPPSPNPSKSGADWFQGGITKLEFDPNDPNMLYAGVFGYGVWRADQSESLRPGNRSSTR